MKQKINVIVFSDDRPGQLSLLLDSIKKNAAEVFNLNVIYSYSDDSFKMGYDKVISKASDDVVFIEREEDFRVQVLTIINEGADYFSFMLDDDIIYREVSVDDIINQIEADDEVACFSLRLGDNATHCYTLGTSNVLHDIKYDGNFMSWDWSVHYLDFGYPFSLDGHIFRKGDIYKLVRKCKFSNIEMLEEGLFDLSETYPRNRMVSYKHSALVGVPVARVQKSIEGEAQMTTEMVKARMKMKKINEKFISDNFIDLESVNFDNINGCHQEIDLGI